MAKPAAPAKPSSAPATGRGGKRPAWDLKGRLEDMEKMFSQTNAMVTDLECERRELESGDGRRGEEGGGGAEQ